MSDRDPAVQMWQESTSARLRRVEAELGSALGALAKASAQVIDLRRLLSDAYDANLLLIQERDEARAATADVESHRKLAAERLTRADLERDQARNQLAALTEPTQEQP